MSKTARILIVEDEPHIRLVFRTTLGTNAYVLSTAEDGETALRWLEQSPYDLVLLDLQMPGLGGMEVLKRLRNSGNCVPVVIITAHGSNSVAVEAMNLGAVDFLTKPVTPSALRAMVAGVLGRHTRPTSQSPGAMIGAPPRANG
jgi:DNA-binding response OmpR family regulator